MCAARCLHFAASWKFYIRRRIWVLLPPFLILHRTLSVILLLPPPKGMTQRLPR